MGLSNHLYKSRKTYKGITKLHKMWNGNKARIYTF